MLQSRLPIAVSAHTSGSRIGARAAAAKRDMASATARDQTATLSLGCFWHPVSCCLKALQCMNGTTYRFAMQDAVFSQLPGVKATEVGYTGGTSRELLRSLRAWQT